MYERIVAFYHSGGLQKIIDLLQTGLFTCPYSQSVCNNSYVDTGKWIHVLVAIVIIDCNFAPNSASRIVTSVSLLWHNSLAKFVIHKE